MKYKHLTLKIFTLIIINDLAEAVAQLLMKKGAIKSGISTITFSNFFEFAARNASSWMVWLGVTISILNFFVWIIILYRADLSIASPLGSTLYVFVPLLAIFFLNEHVGVLRWLGIIIIIAGINLVAKSGQQT